MARRKKVKVEPVQTIEINEEVAHTTFCCINASDINNVKFISAQSIEQALQKARKENPDSKNLRVSRVTFHESATYYA